MPKFLKQKEQVTFFDVSDVIAHGTDLGLG